MPRVKVSKVLSDINFDKCLNDKEHSLLTNTFNDGETIGSRFSLRSGCDDKNKKHIFKDFQKSLKKIEKEKINEQGEILTNKILGTTTFSRKEDSGENKMDDLVQSGAGRKRKHHKKRVAKRKHKKRGRKKSGKITTGKKHHYKHHNIFRNC